jgi:hypothetical protein
MVTVFNSEMDEGFLGLARKILDGIQFRTVEVTVRADNALALERAALDEARTLFGEMEIRVIGEWIAHKVRVVMPVYSGVPVNKRDDECYGDSWEASIRVIALGPLPNGEDEHSQE